MSGMSKTFRELQKRLPGWAVSYSRKHLILTHEQTGARVFTSKTASDYRALLNTIAQCKRTLRNNACQS